MCAEILVYDASRFKIPVHLSNCSVVNVCYAYTLHDCAKDAVWAAIIRIFAKPCTIIIMQMSLLGSAKPVGVHSSQTTNLEHFPLLCFALFLIVSTSHS